MPDTAAVADDQGILFEYLYALRRMLNKKVAKGIAGVNLITAIETGLTVSERVRLEQNDVRKAARQKQQPSQNVLVKCTYLCHPVSKTSLAQSPRVQQCRLQAW